MAISVDNYRLLNGLLAETSYHQIDRFSGDKSQLSFDINVYLSKEKMDEGALVLEKRTFTFTPDLSLAARNHFYQCYAFLKTQEGYENAVDVLEESQHISTS